jgi:intron-binding protein aquarius
LLAKPDELTLATGEMYGEVSRVVGADVTDGEAVMEGVEHLGKYVFEMTKAKVEALKLGGGVLPAVREENGDVAMAEAEADEDAAEREENVLIKEDEVDLGDDGDDDVAEEPVV